MLLSVPLHNQWFVWRNASMFGRFWLGLPFFRQHVPHNFSFPRFQLFYWNNSCLQKIGKYVVYAKYDGMTKTSGSPLSYEYTICFLVLLKELNTVNYQFPKIVDNSLKYYPKPTFSVVLACKNWMYLSSLWMWTRIETYFVNLNFTCNIQRLHVY